MVRVTNYESRTTQEGKLFFVLVLQGEVELVQSSETGKMYATVRKANLPCTFDELTCQALIGKELAGSIEKVDCEPYEYINPQTGEVMLLSQRHEYIPEKSKSSKEIVQQ